MWQCLEINEEIARIRQSKTNKERTRLENPLTEEDKQARETKREDLKNRIGKQ
jgi:hypothetical protein